MTEESKIHEDLSFQLDHALQLMDDREPELSPAEKELYFQIEKYIFPDNQIFASENLEETHQRYLNSRRSPREDNADAPPPPPPT